MNSSDLRQKFLKFFEERGHKIVPSSSILPDDPSVLFTTAGMQQFKPYYTGQADSIKDFGSLNTTSIQKCIRTSDIDEVGDESHLTFFEMLGNFSFGDYFKKEAIKMSYEFLTQELQLDKNKLAFTVFAGDDNAERDEEAASAWKNLGISEKRIAYLPKKDNWWEPTGASGPCGPCTEMFYWSDNENPAPEVFDPADKRWVEIGNDVLMQYEKIGENNYAPAKQKNIDNGTGLERLLAVMNGLEDNYRTDLFWPIIEKIEELSGKKYDDAPEGAVKSMRIIADHLRAATFIMGDDLGVAPSNVDQGYVVRKLIRRAIRHGAWIGINNFFTAEIGKVVINIMKDVYPELEKNREFILDNFDQEEAKFAMTLTAGVKELVKLFLQNKNKRISPQILCKGYHPVKNKNQTSFGPIYEITLNSDKRITCEVEEGRHELLKVKKEDVLNTITWKHHKYLFEQYLKGIEFYTEDGVLINSGSFDGLKSAEARIKITESVGGKLVKKSKLRDWVFARQRYWGEPIPIIHCEKDGAVAVPDDQLPVLLPEVESYEPSGTGESPLANITDWVNTTCPTCGGPAKRETNTMPQWAGSSWYFMRYIDPRNDHALGEKEMLMKWLPVTWYNGGMEHTTLHLLYSRFWYKFLFDIGLTPTSEPYMKRTSQGMILGTGGVKMSKSIGNVINPDVIVKKFGADTLRMYEMFIGPFDQAVAWDDKSVIGIRRFVDRLYSLKNKVSESENSLSIIHKTIKKVGEDIDNMAFNTAISSLMICLNEFEKEANVSQNDFKSFLKLVAPFAPFITEELWKELGEGISIHKEEWPKVDANKLIDNDVTYVLQVNGKLRGEVTLPKDTSKEDVLNAVKSLDSYAKYVGGTTPKQQIFVPGKLVNIVI